MEPITEAIVNYVSNKKGAKEKELVAHICSLSLFYKESMGVTYLEDIFNKIHKIIEDGLLVRIVLTINGCDIHLLLPKDSKVELLGL